MPGFHPVSGAAVSSTVTVDTTTGASTQIGIAEELDEALPITAKAIVGVAEEIDEAMPLIVSGGAGPIFASYYRRMGES